MIQDNDNKVLERTEFVEIGRQIRDKAHKIITNYDAAVKHRREHPTAPDVKGFNMNQKTMYMPVYLYNTKNEVFSYTYEFPHNSNEYDLQELVDRIVKDYIEVDAIRLELYRSR